MPRPPTRTTLFSSNWAHLVQTVAADGLSVEIPCETPKQAQSYRLRFYSYRKSLRLDPERKIESDLADSILVTVEGTKTIFSHRDMTPEAQRIYAAIEAAKRG